MKVLVGCECSGIVRDAFRSRGHDAWSCDLRPTLRPGPHLRRDVRDVLGDQWDLFIVHPDCTYLCSSGLHWNSRRPGRQALTDAAVDFARDMLGAPIERIGLENPVGAIGTRIRPADQYIQPYQFGHDASKKTGLWLKGLPKLQPTRHVPPRMVMDRGKLRPRWANQTDSGQNRLGPREDRGLLRAITYEGVAEAMADQWGSIRSAVDAKGGAISA